MAAKRTKTALSQTNSDSIPQADVKFHELIEENFGQQTNAPAIQGVDLWRGHTAAGVAWHVHRGDAAATLRTLDADRYNCVITSPPYFSQRDYKVDGQMGLEKSIVDFVERLTATMDEVRRVMTRDGVLFLNLGDTYYSGKGLPRGDDKKNKARRFGLRAVDASGLGVPRKTAIGIPWRVALEMIGRGWTLRAPIIWQRSGCLPEPTAHDRPWRTYEMLFLFSRSPRYFFDRSGLAEFEEEDVWHISERPRSSGGLHSAAFPDELVRRCLRVGCPTGGRVLDPFAGTGTTPRVALEAGFEATAIDLSPTFCKHIVKSLQEI